MTDKLIHIMLMHGVHSVKPDKSKHRDLPEDDGKIGKEAFLYVEGNDGDDSFAQCGSCYLWNNTTQRCAILGPSLFVDADDSCGYWLKGKPHDQQCVKRVTPEEAGFVDRPVRCENCKYGGDECELYKALNEALPEMFNIDTKISPYGCCNANTKKD